MDKYKVYLIRVTRLSTNKFVTERIYLTPAMFERLSPVPYAFVVFGEVFYISPTYLGHPQSPLTGDALASLLQLIGWTECRPPDATGELYALPGENIFSVLKKKGGKEES